MNRRYDWPDVDQAALRAARTARLKEFCDEAGLDHILLQEPDNIRYATGYRSHLTADSAWHAALVSADGEAEVFVEYVDETIENPIADLPNVRALHPHPGWSPASANPRTWVRLVAGRIAAAGARRIGVDAIDVALVEALRRACPSVEFVPSSTAFYRVRRVKDPLEIVLVEAASRVNSLAMDAAMSIVAPGVTDDEILGEAARAQLKAGVEFVTHSVCNVRGGSGAWFARNASLREGDAYFFDIGCYGVGGYGSDAARTAFVGEPRREVFQAYQHLLAAYEIARDLARPGVRMSAIHRAVNDYLSRQGLGRTPYAIGHGIGLRLCELPVAANASLMDVDDTLETGMCIALEPETSVEAGGAIVVVKVEDNFVVEETGLRALTTPYPAEAALV
ncbi:aminopeptidase P family protein [Amycolatopsis rubida]|uniref:Aminopeptidase P family protein n=1 Tax=Amycolatopsis rubida TaxID=112413 RepID=A0A1I5ZG59_9PSEU|nr:MULTISPECIES: Xaa-Pro peptidase family protein [Amycolatopsis]MYW92987.1 M24 family metallopeptidase [Amycolatopsis rubida]NEC57974.1 aminopeptidase P family protein [Amycolatopsis rubida]OAP25512.1 putative peptidase [Amycolatopsis sp. M39]SFQ55410.1 Xaa-Pro aminopeptidase [Amycolatopsis rubida]